MNAAQITEAIGAMEEAANLLLRFDMKEYQQALDSHGRLIHAYMPLQRELEKIEVKVEKEVA